MRCRLLAAATVVVVPLFVVPSCGHDPPNGFNGGDGGTASDAATVGLVDQAAPPGLGSSSGSGTPSLPTGDAGDWILTDGGWEYEGDAGGWVLRDGGWYFAGDAGPWTCLGGAADCNVQCADGGTTSVSGTVYAPNGSLPLYNVIVYVPNAPLSPMDAGISCDQCGVVASGEPITTALSDATGHFILNNVPVGPNIPLVVQLGKWRRETKVPTVTGCTDNALSDPNLTRLPRNQSEGSMPHVALTTGSCDSMGCMLPKVGIDPAEFGVQSDGYGKAINVYSSADDQGGSDGLANTTPASTLWGSLPLLSTYDIGIFSCECEEALTGKGVPANQIDPNTGLPTSLPVSPDFQHVTDYLNAGGRIFTTDFQYTWYRYSPDPNIGATSATNLNNTGLGVIPGGAPSGLNPLMLNEGFPKGLALARWLSAVFPTAPALVEPDGGPLLGASINADSIWDNVQSLNAAPQSWATADAVPNVFTLNTPVGVPASQQCGKGVHLDVHITESMQGGADFVGCNAASGNVGSSGCYPTTCTNPLKQDEAMFAFFFFDLAACIQNEGVAPTPPPPPPPPTPPPPPAPPK